MATSVLGSILDAVVSQIQGKGLTYQNVAVPVAVRKLPRAEETLDQVPLIAVTPETKGETREPWSTEDEVLAKYPINVSLVLPGNADYTETNLDLLATFREAVNGLFQWLLQGGTLPAGVDLFKIEPLPDPIYDREKLANQYEYSGLGFRCWVVSATSR